jgi:hypothetical protein
MVEVVKCFSDIEVDEESIVLRVGSVVGELVMILV